jgi:hypothetical protein
MRSPRHARLFTNCGLLLLIAVGTTAGCRGPHGTKGTLVQPPEARQLLLDRNWLDRLPSSPQDRLHVFRFVPKMGGGVFQDRTLYAGQFELFHFDQDGQRIHFKLPHTDEDVRTPFAIERLHLPEEDAPFELHLHIDSSPRGPSDYYSLRGDGAADLDSLLLSVTHKK